MSEPGPVALLRPSLPTADELRPWLDEIDRGARYTNFGPLCKRLEAALGRVLAGAPPAHVAAVSSGTLGLELALAALGLPAGARVLLPALTFPAAATATLRAGLTPVIGDVDPDTWCLAPGAAGAAGADAVLPVAVFGRPLDTAAWEGFAEASGRPVLIDAAGAFGNQRVGRRCNAVFSMHATKAFAAGEGGFVASADPDFCRGIRVAANFGFDHESPAGSTIGRPGTNAKLSEYHAAVGLAALANWPDHAARRLALAERYVEGLRGCGGRVALQDGGASWVRSVFVVRVPAGVDDDTIAALARRGVEARRWYWPPLHRHPAFAGCERAGELATAEALAGQLLGLPFHLHLKDDTVDRVCRALDEVLP